MDEERKEYMDFAIKFKQHRHLHHHVQAMTRGERMSNDFVLTANMVTLRSVINVCFDPDNDPLNIKEESSSYWTLGQSVENMCQEMQYGPYTNTEVIEIASKAYIST